jgi:molecular chaperone DnaK
VSAKDLGTGNEQQIRIEGGSGLSEDEVDRMISEAESHAGEAHRLHELADARNAAEQLAYQTERTLSEHRDKLPEAEAATIEGRIMELRQAAEGSELADIQAKTTALEGASRSLADAIYAQASEQASTQASGNGDGVSDDEVVEDADFEVIDEEEAAKS